MESHLNSFATIQLTPAPGDRRLYALKGIGTLRVTGWASRTATAEAGGRVWQLASRGVRQPVIEAADAAGVVVGHYGGRARHRDGMLHWSDRELALRPDSLWPERYVLVDGDRRLATIEGQGLGRCPVNIRVDGVTGIDPGLLLFAVFVVGTLAHNAIAVTAA